MSKASQIFWGWRFGLGLGVLALGHGAPLKAETVPECVSTFKVACDPYGNMKPYIFGGACFGAAGYRNRQCFETQPDRWIPDGPDTSTINPDNPPYVGKESAPPPPSSGDKPGGAGNPGGTPDGGKGTGGALGGAGGKPQGAGDPPKTDGGTTPGTDPVAGTQTGPGATDGGPSGAEGSQNTKVTATHTDSKPTGEATPAPTGTPADGGTSASAEKKDEDPLKDNKGKGDELVRDREFRALENTDSSDRCAVSSTIDGKFSCDGTDALIQGSKVANALTQATGSIATAALGQSQQASAMSEGTQSAALRAAATTARASGGMQMAAGATNALAGVLQLSMSGVHSSDGKKIKKSVTGGYDQEAAAHQTEMKAALTNSNSYMGIGHAGDADETAGGGVIRSKDIIKGSIAQEFRLNNVGSLPTIQAAAGTAERTAEVKARHAAMQQKVSTMNTQARDIANKAKKEQDAVAKEALMGGMQSLMTGGGQMVGGGFALAAADNLDAAADNMAAIEAKVAAMPSFTPFEATPMTPGDALAPGNGQTISGATSAPMQSASTEDSGAPDLGSLGKPLGGEQKDDLDKDAKVPGAFQAGGPTGGGSGNGAGGGFSGGGASTQAAQADQGDPQAKMADNSKGGGYDGNGGTVSAGAGGGGGADRGPDLSGLLAQFLPKKDEDGKNANGILDFGGRNPAAEGPISLLDRNANIFERIHETYQDKSRRGKVGI